MKTNRKVIIYLLLLVVFIMYQFSANYIFNILVKTDKESGTVNFSLPPETQVVKFNVEEVNRQILKWKDGLFIGGWVLKLPVPKKKKDVYLVLRSTGTTLIFKVKNNNIPRQDVLNYFKLESTRFKKGFEMVIPLFYLSEDAYHIGFIIEDETGKYYSTSSLELRKISGDFTVVDLKAELTEAESGPDPASLSHQLTVPIQKPTKEAKYNFDTVNKSRKILTICGWGFLDGLDASSLKTYILLKKYGNTLVFDVKPMLREDVTSYNKKTGLNLDSSGFKSVIPIGNLEKGSYQLGMYFTKGIQSGVVYSDKFIEIGE